MLEKFFKLKENHTDVKTEVLAGITTFMTMAYILAVNPTMLADAGMDKTAVLIATCDGASCKLSVCAGSGYGIECVFCIYGMQRYGIFLASGTYGSVYRRNYLYCTFTYQCA